MRLLQREATTTGVSAKTISLPLSLRRLKRRGLMPPMQERPLRGHLLSPQASQGRVLPSSQARVLRRHLLSSH